MFAYFERFSNAILADVVKAQGVVLYIEKSSSIYLKKKHLEFALCQFALIDGVVHTHTISIQKCRELGTTTIVGDVVGNEVASFFGCWHLKLPYKGFVALFFKLCQRKFAKKSVAFMKTVWFSYNAHCIKQKSNNGKHSYTTKKFMHLTLLSL